MNDSDAKSLRNENGRRLLVVFGLVAFLIASWLGGAYNGVWLAPLGVGLVLTAWLSYNFLPLWGVSHFVMLQFFVGSSQPWAFHLTFSILLTAQIGVIWLAYSTAVRGSRRMDDPQNATVFLVLIAIIAAAFAWASVLLAEQWLTASESFWRSVSRNWLSNLLGVLVPAPPLFVILGPFLQAKRVIPEEEGDYDRYHAGESRWMFGEQLETAGLSFAACFLALAMTLDADRGLPNWRWWIVLLLVIVWASLRLRLRGGLLAASLSSFCALAAASVDERPVDAAVFQGYLLALCSSALLVGVSSNWIRASEDRFRQLMGHLPVVLYSVRLSSDLPDLNKPNRKPSAGRDDAALVFWRLGQVTLVSAGAKELLGCRPEDLMGSLEKWKRRIQPADLEVVQAAYLQLTRENRSITFEYRVLTSNEASVESADTLTESEMWVRDTLVPHYHEDGQIDGWDGVLQNITESRRLAQQLRRTSGMLHALIENLPTGVFFVQGPEGRPILVNARARQLLGRREDVTASIRHLADVFRLHRSDGHAYPVDDLPVTKALRSGLTSMADDIVVHRGDGRKVPLITWAAPVDLGSMGKRAAVWVLEDLTALHQAELSRRESEARLRAVVETMAEGVVVFDNRRKIVELNPAAQEIFGDAVQLGATLAEVEGVFCWEDGTPAPADKLPIATVFESRLPVRNIVLGLRNQAGDNGDSLHGAVRWVTVNAIPLPAIRSFTIKSGEARVVATFADVTGHRHAMEQLRNAKDKYQNLIESLPLTVLQFDAEHQLTFANPAAYKFLGYGPDELFVPGFLFGVLHDDSRAQFQKALQQRSKSPLEISFIAKDSTTKHGFVFVQPQATAAGDGVDCLIVDMTRQRHLEHEVRKAQRLELVGKLAGGTIHDFNNLLAAMIGSASLAQLDVPPEHPAQISLQRILDAGEQASHLAGQLLAFSKTQQFRITRVDLHKTLTHTVNLLQSVMPSQSTVHVELADQAYFVPADENALKQVIMNLCLNARDSIPDDGVIRLTSGTGLLPAAVREQAHGRDNGNPIPKRWVYFAVADDGAGISNEIRPRLFEPFFSTKERGTGLGLAIVRQIIDRFDGFIEVESEAGRGARFCVWLPPYPPD